MQQLKLFDSPRRSTPPAMPAPYAAKSATSQAAAAAIAGEARFIRQRVLAFIRSRRDYGATDPEISEALGLPGDSSRPRRIELRDAGTIVDSGRTRPTRSGRAATVWIISSKIGFYHE